VGGKSSCLEQMEWISSLLQLLRSQRRNSAISIVISYGLNGQGVELESYKGRIFLLSTSSRLVLGPMQPHISWGTLSLWVKQSEREADHSTSS
jgi:hypothetical protein